MTRFTSILSLIVIANGALAQDGPDPKQYVGFLDACVEEAVGATELRACIGSASGPCMEREPSGMSTLGMMFCTIMEGSLWDDKLNAEYQQRIQEAKEFDTEQRAYSDGAYAVLEESLREVQRAWIPFRDAQCALEYAEWGAGSMRNVAGSDCHRTMTAERVIYFMTGGEEASGE